MGHYEGTKFDMSKGLAAGPWADPDRWTVESTSLKGNFERSIGLFRTEETHVVQARRGGVGTVLWYGPHSADGTVFFPVPMAATEAEAGSLQPRVLNEKLASFAAE